MKNLNLETIWHSLSTDLLDLGMRSKSVRDWALRHGEKLLYQHALVDNPENRPWKIQEMRYLTLRNLLHAVDRALSDGRISAQVRRSIIKNFIGKGVMGVSERMRPFREKHGYEPPFFLTISPTKKCNLKCKGCYAGSTSKNAETLAYPLFHRVIREKTEQWGSHLTVISGGEPFLYKSEGKDIFDLFKDNQDNYFLMYTNGTLIDKDCAAKLAELGNVSPAISVEGWEKETDERRGKGVFRKIMQAMENLRNAGVPCGISVTATRENAEILLSEPFIDFYFNQQGVIYGWIFQYMPIGRSYTIDMMVTPEQRRWLLEQEMKMIYERKLFYVDFWNGGPMTVGCLAAGRPGGYFYIDWNGNIAPCVFFPCYVNNLYDLYREDRTITEALHSPLFRSIREWQDAYGYAREPAEVKNLFTPCAIRDHYYVACQSIKKSGACHMDENASKAIQDLDYRRRMLEYDRRIAELLDPLWEDEVIFHELPAGGETKKASVPI